MYILVALVIVLGLGAIKLWTLLRWEQNRSRNLELKLREEKLKHDPIWREKHRFALGLLSALSQERNMVENALTDGRLGLLRSSMPVTDIEHAFFRRGDIDDEIGKLQHEIIFLEKDYVPQIFGLTSPYRN